MSHKKAIKLTLTTINTLLVLVLFASAVLLFYSVSDKSPTMFGYSLFLIKDDITNKTNLVFVDKGAKLLPNSEFLFISEKNNGSRICTVNESAGDMITFSLFDDDGTEYSSSVSVSSEEYGGIVKWQNRFLGKLFEPFSQRSNMPFIYMLIGGMCALILLLLTLLYFFFQKKDVNEEVVVSDEDNYVAEAEAGKEKLEDEEYELDIPPNQIPPPFITESSTTKKKEVFSSLPSISVVTSPPTPENPIFIEESHFTAEAVSDEEYVPSIESLIAEIDLLGKGLDESFKK